MARKERTQSERLKLEEVVRLLSAVGHESDRGCVLTFVALLDSGLEAALRNFFKSVPNHASDKLIDGLLIKGQSPAIGNLAVRISMARALGLIDDKMRTALDCLRQSRNDAAHLYHSFSISEIDMSAIDAALSAKNRHFADFMCDKEDDESTKFRVRFEISAIALYGQIVRHLPLSMKDSDRDPVGAFLKFLAKLSHAQSKGKLSDD